MDDDLKAAANDYVVLLHGLSKDPQIMMKLERFLESLGYDVHNIAYPSTQYPIDGLASQVWESIQKACPDTHKKIHFVVHSLGSLITRKILSAYSLPNLGRVVMIAPPNHGTEVVDFLVKFKFYRKNFGPAGMQLITGPNGYAAKLPQKVDYDLGIIAGSRTVDLFFTWFILPSKGDGKITIENTKLEGMRDHIVVPASHPHITNKAVTAHQVAYFLKYDKFDHS
jgi:triacylglycerol esterase/lipase EstA (alpha/beta hydrolase family)